MESHKLCIIFVLMWCCSAASVIGIYPCPDGWTPSLSNMCLKISSTAKTWDLAWMDCLGQGGELLTLETKEKSIYIKGWLNDKGISMLWIGGRSLCDRWQWTGLYKGNITKYDWAPGEPNSDGYSHCLMLTTYLTVQHQWNDHICGAEYRYICEKKAR